MVRSPLKHTLFDEAKYYLVQDYADGKLLWLSTRQDGIYTTGLVSHAG